MSAASLHAPTTTTASSSSSPSSRSPCPWGAPPAATATSPKLQEILDEQLARQINELELEQLTQALVAEEAAADAQWEALDYASSDISEDSAAEEDDDSQRAGREFEEDDSDDDKYDAADAADEMFQAKNQTSTRGAGSRRRNDAASILHLAGNFDDRTVFVLGKLAARRILTAVNSRVHASSTSLVHHGTNLVEQEDSEEPVAVHYAVKILKTSAIDHGAQKTSESLQRSNRPANEDMLWMSVRRQLKIQMDREYSALSRAVASGVRAPTPVCSWEHVLVMSFVGNGTKAAPRLRDAVLNKGQLAQSFVDLLSSLRAMYQQAKFVHGGLNEYSILYHKDACWITDFSGAIDVSHDEHAEALERDIAFVHNFFAGSGMPQASKHNVGLLSEAAMHEIVTEEAPNKALSASPWLKPYLYKKK